LEYDNALKDYNRAVKLVPNDPDAYKFRGFVYLKLNNREKACSDLLRAEQLGAQGVEQFITANNCANN
jgi:regulator of sirC expression with transglutaminase-like and TPR domain